MKPLLSILTFICLSQNTAAQDNFPYVDNKALRIPKNLTYSTDSIARYINSNFSTDKEKTRALYTWVINNIAYSKDSIGHFNRWGIDPEINMNAILRRRKGVCENYASLFANILSKCGVQSAVVTGYTNIPANNYWNGHGWVAAQVDSAWFLCDPTWDAGHNSYRYFLVDPEDFIESHMPFDPMWQLLANPVSHNNFQRGRFHIKDTVVFNYKDSVAAYLKSDTLQQMQAAARRMQQSGFDNEDVKTWQSFTQMKVHIVQQEENMQLFNDAVANLNKAKGIYNRLVEYRNNNFLPEQTKEETGDLFASIDKLLATAYNQMEGIGKKAENYQYDTDALKESLNTLSAKTNEQKDYFKNNLAARKK